MRLLPVILFMVSTFSFLSAQDTNKIVQDEETGKPMLIGPCTREAFSDTSFSGWFDSEYEAYKPDSVTVKEIEYNMDGIKITVVMGTWCSDSREQVPHFFKVMDEAGYTENNITMICVNREKKDSSGSVDSLNIELVPTFIFYRDGKEIGRITETPKQTMEEDIYAILTDSTE
jgi:thiol-disulfide isomerase/thioredoxin